MSRPAEQVLQDALEAALDPSGCWLYVPEGRAEVQVVTHVDNLPVRRYQARSLLAALASAYDDAVTGQCW